MKRSILTLYGAVCVMFAVLIGFTSYWSVFDAEELEANPKNRRALLKEERIRRGVIRARDGTVLAGSRRLPDGRYRRRYPQGELFGHPVGYAYTEIARAGIEQAYNEELIGERSELVSVVDALLNREQVGRDVDTTLDPDAQRVATDALRASPSGRGAAVALDAKTGAVRALVSVPGFDPTNLDAPGRYRKLANDETNTPLFSRATQGLFPPGSTFKVVTAAAALDSGDYTPDSMIDGSNGVDISGVPLNNFGDADYGPVTLTEALTKSVNTVFGRLGEDVGKGTMQRYMRRFGFGTRLRMDLDEVSRSGERIKGKLVPATDRRVDVGRMAIGQDQLLVTPLQMASVAQTIANGGERMDPYLVGRAVDADGRATYEHESRGTRVISAASARALDAMMQQVVREGTGTAAALSGINVAGKTGTAELDAARSIDNLWFIGYAEGNAVAVIVERAQGGTGGEDAAPIAKRILEALR